MKILRVGDINKEISLIDIEEVQKHNTIEDCWIVAHNKVYDVTSFINRHPGGKYVIKSNAGKRVSRHFDYHSKRSHKLWEKYLIGYIEEQTKNCGCL